MIRRLALRDHEGTAPRHSQSRPGLLLPRVYGLSIMLRSLSIAATRPVALQSLRETASIPRLARSQRLAVHSGSTRHVTSSTIRASANPTNSAQARHETLTSTLAKPPGVAASTSSNSTTSTTDHAVAAALQKQRIQHGALQSALAFVTVLISAQSLKNAQENRKLERERDALLELVADKNQVLQGLVNDEAAFDRLARECLIVLQEESNNDESQRRNRPGFIWRSWSGRGDTDSHDDQDDVQSDTLDRLVEILRSDLVARVGKAGLTREQQDQLQLKELLVASQQQQQQSQSMTKQPDKQQRHKQQQQSAATGVIDAETDALLEQLLNEESSESWEGRKRTVYAF